MNEKRIEKREKEPKIIKIASIGATAVTGSNYAIQGAFEAASKKEGAPKFDNTIFELLSNEHETGYSEKTLKQLYKLLDDKDFIGISTIGYNHVEKIEPLIKSLKEHYGGTKPIIIGGDHAILNPEACWELGVDALCFGEAEKDYPTLLENWDRRFDPEIRKKIKNFALNGEEIKKLMAMREQITEIKEKGGKIGKIPDLVEPKYQEFSRKYLTREELDEFPYFFGLEKTYVNIDGEIVPKTPENMFGTPQHQAPQDQNVLTYSFMRGCVNKCDYCYYNTLEKITGQRTFRTLSPEKAIENLKHGKEYIEKTRQSIVDNGGDAGPEPFLLLMNSDTCAMPIRELTKFCDSYKEEIGYPFYCMNNPLSATKEKMKMLARAGMVHMNFGVQTNEDVNKRCYNRNSSDKQVIKLTQWAKEIEKEEGLHIDVLLDFIIYNPFETREDLRKTIEFIKKIDTPFDVSLIHTVRGVGFVLEHRTS